VAERQNVTIRHATTGEEREVTKKTAQFFTNAGWVEIDKAGRVKPGQTEKKDN